LDSKEDGPKLKDAPQMKDFLCPQCSAQYQTFRHLVSKTPFKFEENSKLVRGLDYYTGVVFEIVSPVLGAQNAVAAGGRYDELVEFLGGPPTPAVGFALGMDRVVEAHLQSGVAGPNSVSKNICSVIPLVEIAVPQAFELIQSLRSQGFIVPPLMSFKKKLKNQLSSAVEIGAKYAILIGEDELKSGQWAVKNMIAREQTLVPQNQIVEFLKK